MIVIIKVMIKIIVMITIMKIIIIIIIIIERVMMNINEKQPIVPSVGREEVGREGRTFTGR